MSANTLAPLHDRHRRERPDADRPVDLIATTRSAFAATDLQSLLHGDAPAVRITDFLDPTTLAHIRDSFVGRTDHGPLATDARFRRIGHAFAETTDADDRERYFGAAIENLNALRALAAPHVYPADSIRLLLDDVWPTGTTLLRHDGRPFFAGVARYQQGGVDLEPHTDNIDRNLPPELGVAVARQLSVNVYLDVPDAGGELEIWDEYPDESDYRDRIGDRTYGVDRDSVGRPRWVIRPQPGEAIFIDPRRIHAVASSHDRPRITIGLFVGVVSDSSPLVVWS